MNQNHNQHFRLIKKIYYKLKSLSDLKLEEIKNDEDDIKPKIVFTHNPYDSTQNYFNEELPVSWNFDNSLRKVIPIGIWNLNEFFKTFQIEHYISEYINISNTYILILGNIDPKENFKTTKETVKNLILDKVFNILNDMNNDWDYFLIPKNNFEKDWLCIAWNNKYVDYLGGPWKLDFESKETLQTYPHGVKFGLSNSVPPKYGSDYIKNQKLNFIVIPIIIEETDISTEKLNYQKKLFFEAIEKYPFKNSNNVIIGLNVTFSFQNFKIVKPTNMTEYEFKQKVCNNYMIKTGICF